MLQVLALSAKNFRQPFGVFVFVPIMLEEEHFNALQGPCKAWSVTRLGAVCQNVKVRFRGRSRVHDMDGALRLGRQGHQLWYPGCYPIE